ncbi:PGC-1 and ERR-induced regulator in muscle protein 1 [Nycticebus coucang]|uniref:PGC-1 and ERR-induced regulator in muscle protein 1 n=1 Tax=Nycticebus coucang TaxID=9470 RepID=UPI00234CF68A|nr:PGC-1 and ERR-induced regulator in muscle protein 1 [Nycticebus coucang]
MENFQYSVQLSDQDWAEFSATADECGLLQAGLASGDELLSSDIDQEDSSGPSGQKALGEQGLPGCQEEDVAAQQLVSRSPCEPILALGASEQIPSTSALSLGSGAPPPSSALLVPVSCGDEKQRVLQGPDPSPPGMSSWNPRSPGHNAALQEPWNNPGALPRSSSRKKRRTMGAKAGGHSGASGPAPAQLGSLLLTAQPEESLGLAGPRGKSLDTGEVMPTAGTRQDKLGPDSAGIPRLGSSAPEPLTGRGPGLDLSAPVSVTEQSTDQFRMTPRGELFPESTPAKEAHLDFSMAKPDVTVPTPDSRPPPNVTLSTLTSKPRLDVDLPTEGPEVKPEVPSTPVSVAVPHATLPHSVSKVKSDEGVFISAPRADAAAPSQSIVLQAEPHVVEMKTGVITRAKPLAEFPGHFPGEHRVGPIQTSKKKKVRFSMTETSPEEPASRVALGPPSPSIAWPSPPRIAPGGHEEPRTWDVAAIGPRTPKPRILKHLPPPAPSALRAPGPRSQFAVTLPEAYEFFFCDTIEEEEEEEEDAEEVAITSQTLAEVQWPDICEFFFRDCQAQRPSPWGCCSLAPPPRAEAVPAPLPEDPVPISIPEAYEHFFREDRSGGDLGPASLGEGPGPARAERLGLMVRRAGELQGPLTSFTFSQNDMCLVFVAFATWAVRTSDLHSPDAWKTVLLANIGTISAIRHFRRQMGQGHCDPSCSTSS